jgi:microcystin-dependent protein
MSQPYVGEIRMFAGNFAPAEWMFCDGTLLPISEYEVLFNLIGTIYGGDGQSTFALPDLRGRVPVHLGQSLGASLYTIGQMGGAEVVTLTVNQMPNHLHHAASSNVATLGNAAGDVLGDTGTNLIYSQPTGAPTDNFAAQALQSAGNSQPHNNMMPFCGVNFIISLFGIYPTQV